MKRIQVAFAESGDKTDIPTTAQGDGSVSYPTGYGADYEKNLDSDPTAKRIERQKMNQVLNDLSSNVKLFQDQSFPEFVSTADNGGNPMAYPKGAVVMSSGLMYQSLSDNNSHDITDFSHWTGIAPKGEYVAHGSYFVGDIVKGSDNNRYYCNKINNTSGVVDPVGDNSDTWRRYPYYEASNGGIEYRIYYDDTYEFWGREQVQSTKVPAGSGVSIYDGSKSINAPLSMMKGSGNRNCDSNCSDSPNITSESSIIYPVNLNTSTSLIIRAGGATATATPPATTTMDVDFRVWGKLVR